MPRTKITFYGGVDEIGGNKILVEDKGTRVFLDFGKGFSSRSQFYDWTEKPRTANGIGDLLALGIIPDVDGIYREDLLSLAGRTGKQDCFVDAVVLSHAHADHADYISFLREDIPVWMGETARDIIRSIEAERNRDLEYEISNFKRRPLERGSEVIPREIRTFSTGSKVSIDSILVEPVHVDHSIPGCYGFIISTSDSAIVYSGDLRMHGNRPDLTHDFLTEASKVEPDLMLCEGTRINESSSGTERDVYDACKDHVEKSGESFVFADFSYKDVDRLSTFYRVAKSTGRELLISARTARYMEALSANGKGPNLPSWKDPNVAIYQPRVKSGTYDDDDYDEEDMRFYNGGNVWNATDVRKKESNALVALGASYVNQLIDIRPRGGLYIHSMSEPFNEEGEMDEERMSHWMERFSLRRVHSHCSGHASGEDLKKIVKTIQPKALLPIHTEHPELFKTFGVEKLVQAAINSSIEVQ